MPRRKQSQRKAWEQHVTGQSPPKGKRSRSTPTKTTRFEQPEPYKTENGVNWYLIETDAHRPYTKTGVRGAPGIYVDMIGVK